ncbi:SGNH/GDSL hydrolase family protein [Ramlibacter sp.]|uniref:SGNH/GDSL hydrolase family protein n=1 Tax=Ramlibacter sp. TaxID=1917967 RepID=UPI002FC902DF
MVEPLGDWGMRLAWVCRAWCDRRARHSVLVLGDSHVRVFEHWWFMWSLPQVRWDIVYVPGGTAAGLPNPNAATQARSRFEQALATAAHDLVLLNLGEVDTGYNVWMRAARQQADPRLLMEQAAKRYTDFIERVAARHRLVVIGAPLPTLADDFVPGDDVGSTRKQVTQSQAERTALTLAFNEQVGAACARLGVPHLDDRSASLGPGGVVRASWQRMGRADHHYDRKTYARWLACALRPYIPADPA